MHLGQQPPKLGGKGEQMNKTVKKQIYHNQKMLCKIEIAKLEDYLRMTKRRVTRLGYESATMPISKLDELRRVAEKCYDEIKAVG